MLTIDVDDHSTQETPRENGLTVRGAIQNAHKDSLEELRPQSTSDTVTVNGQPSSYDHMISQKDGDNAHIEIETDKYRAEKASKHDNPSRLLNRAARKEGKSGQLRM